MSDARAERRSDFFVRALAVVVAATLAHLALALAFVHQLTPPGGIETPTEAIHVSVLLAGVIGLAMMYLRVQYAAPTRVAPAIATVLRLVPPAAILLLAPLIVPAEILEGPTPNLVAAIAPPLCATWAAAYLVSIPSKRILYMLGTRSRLRPPNRAAQFAPAPRMAEAYMRIMAGASFCAGLLVLGAWLPRSLLAGQAWHAASFAPAAGLVAVATLAALAGTSLGQSPGEDIVAVTNSLRALTEQSKPTRAEPIAVTSFDEAGELMSNLERLRARLLDDLDLYQEALDRTREADAIKSDFLSAVSHELRTPLNSVGGFAQLLLEGEGGALTEPQAEDVRLIRAGGHQLLELINDILDISMIESGELRLSFSRADLAEVIRDLVDIHRPLVRESNVALSHELGPNVPSVVCDRRRIVQILTNLVSNAIKFTELGHIVVRAAWDPQADNIVIRVIDTGVGIAEDELEAIFEEYRQAGPVKRRKKGTGLGLSIARTIAEHHGGSLTVESVPGEGSTFTLTLPRTPPTRPTAIDMAARTGRLKAARTMAPGVEA
jgi:signal transduction histidine kinase